MGLRITFRTAAWGLGMFFGLGVALLVYFRVEDNTAASAETRTLLPVRVSLVHFLKEQREHSFPALIAPRYESDVGFRVAGKIISRQVEIGDVVEKGTILAQLDASDLALQARLANSEVAAATAEWTLASSDLRRVLSLRASHVISEQAFDQQQALTTASAERLAQARSNLHLAQDSLGYATLVADQTGVVSGVIGQPGQFVAPGQPVLTIARLDGDEAVADIPEQYVAAIGAATLSVELWSRPSLRIPGKLREVAPVADPATRTFQVRVTLLGTDASLRYGMSATLVSQPEGSAREETSLPLTALTNAANGSPAVWVVDQTRQSVRLQPVDIEGYSDDSVLIGAGLREGEVVVTAGVQKLTADTKVQVWTEPLR